MTSDHRIKVTITTRVRTELGDRAVRVVALSAKTALLFAPESIGLVGQCVDVVLPALERELDVTAGIERVERVVEGHAVIVRFIVADNQLRTSLNELLALLLAGSGGGSRKHPRILYDVPIFFGDDFEKRAVLEDISLGGLSMRVRERFATDVELKIRIPQIRSRSPVVVVGRVVNQRLSLEGGYHTGVAFNALGPEQRMELSALLSDLMSR